MDPGSRSPPTEAISDFFSEYRSHCRGGLVNWLLISRAGESPSLLELGGSIIFRFTSFLAVLVVFGGVQRAQANFEENPPQASTTDVWNGATITNHSPLHTDHPFSIDNVLGGTSFEGDTPIRNIIFDDLAATPQFLEWEIAEPVTIAQVGVFLKHDGSDFDNRRALDVTILAKAAPADSFAAILSQSLSDPVSGDTYGGGQFGTSVVEYFSILDVDSSVPNARFFRAEFTPNTVGVSGDGPPNVGVRVLELDGHPIPEPSTLVLLSVGAVGLLVYAVRRRPK